MSATMAARSYSARCAESEREKEQRRLNFEGAPQSAASSRPPKESAGGPAMPATPPPPPAADEPAVDEITERFNRVYDRHPEIVDRFIAEAWVQLKQLQEENTRRVLVGKPMRGLRLSAKAIAERMRQMADSPDYGDRGFKINNTLTRPLAEKACKVEPALEAYFEFRGSPASEGDA